MLNAPLRSRPILDLILTLALLMLAVSSPSRAAAEPGFAPKRFAAISVDAGTGRTLFARSADAQRYPASLTKVMTLYLAFDEIERGRLKLTDKITMSRHAAAQPPSKLGLAPGEQLTVKEAIDIIVVKSANDVAAALAEKISGSESAFARKMNAQAKRLGMKRTHFVNASGLPDPRQVTTARDLSVLALAVLKDHPQRYRVFAQDHAVFRGRRIAGHNRLLSSPGFDGIKTGYTRASGFNLMTSAERDDRRVVAVVLGGATAAVRDTFMRKIVQTSFGRLPGPDDEITLESAAAETVAAPGRSDLPPTAAVAEGDASEETAWWVQVGAFKSRERGLSLLSALRAQHPRRLGETAQTLDRTGSLYRARFAMDSSSQARETCALLEAEGQECLWLTVGPDS